MPEKLGLLIVINSLLIWEILCKRKGNTVYKILLK